MPSKHRASTTSSASSNKNNQQLYIGVDGGGSKCKAVLMDENNQILGTGTAGPGNPLHGFEQATNSITESAKLALTNAGLQNINLSEIIAGVGLAGVNLPILFEQMTNWQHPFKRMFLATDLLIACLGAHQGEDGAVMITGTGSCGFSYVDQKALIVGAHGFPHGDKASGAWFGLQAAKQVLLSLDGLGGETAMTQKLLALTNCQDDVALVEAIANKPATFYAKFANLVFDAAEEGDDIAKEIIQEGCAYITSVANKLWQQQPAKMSMIGGLTSRLIKWLPAEIANKLTAPLSPPEVGAVLFAKQQLKIQNSDKIAV
ncbi:MAG: ATPase [Gammaproteobacteria bacterium]|nr:MAG: ATPase [Gammaproteobacteria bacterium]